MWDKESNLKAYDNIERMSNYKNAEELTKYRNYLLEKSKIQSDFIKGFFNEKAKIFEACSGNSRLLYRLYIDDLLQEGKGVEISSSRVNFAEQWKKDFNQANIANICEDIIEYNIKEQYYNLVICITSAFGYFYPIDETYPSILLDKFKDMLQKDGYLLLELYQHPKVIEFCKMDDNKKMKRWIELPEDDPFRFYLTEYTYHESQNCLEGKEIFIRRDGYIDDSKREIIKIYPYEEIKGILEGKGFSIEGAYSDWDKKEYDINADKLIIIAKKN